MRRLPLHHALLNARRRPTRSLYLVVVTALICALFATTASFVRSLERSHLNSASPTTAILVSSSAMRDLVRSAMSPAVAEEVAAATPGVVRVNGVPAASAEIHMGTEIRIPGREQPTQAFARGVTERAFLVHEQVTLLRGRMPGPREVLVGRLAAAKAGIPEESLEPGTTFSLEGGNFRVAGVFAAPGTTIEAEIWVALHELQALAKRDDCIGVFVRVETPDDLGDVEIFALRRVDLELVAIPAPQYYAEMAAYFGPILALAWAMVVLVAIAAAAGGANAINASIQDRMRELATLRVIGFRTTAVAWSVLQETAALAMAGILLGLLLARLALGSVSISIAMTAFSLEIDPACILIGMGGTAAVVALASLPALAAILRLPIVRALKES